MLDARLRTLKLREITLQGIANGGTETCIMVPEYRLMFDVGMCPRAALKYSRILLSHAHADHAGGLPYLISQRGMIRRGAPSVHLPNEALEGMRGIIKAWSELEGFELEANLEGHLPGDRVELGKKREALALRTVHRVPSLAWIVLRRTQKLKREFMGRAGPELAQLRRQGVNIADPVSHPLLCVSGDTQIELFDREELVRRCRVLLYEVTSWDDRSNVERTRRWGHTHIDELAVRAEQFTGETLVLVHRGGRYSLAEAEAILQKKFPREALERTVIFP